jgi:two-component system, response regulator / RNA-binding antiterminator
MQSILLLVDDASRAASLRKILESLRYRIVDELRDPAALSEAAARHQPDLIVLRTDSPTQPMFDALRSLSEATPRPVVVFANDPSRNVIRSAVDAGAAAYVVDGWSAERVTPIIDAACARFEAYEAVRKQLAATQNKLSERKVIEKAKGIVMHQRGLTEDHAYAALRKMAMDQNLELAEVARRVIAVAQLLA